MNENILACMFLKVEGSYTVSGVLLYNQRSYFSLYVLKSGRFSYADFYCIMNEEISACIFLKMEGSYTVNGVLLYNQRSYFSL